MKNTLGVFTVLIAFAIFAPSQPVQKLQIVKEAKAASTIVSLRIALKNHRSRPTTCEQDAAFFAYEIGKQCDEAGGNVYDCAYESSLAYCFYKAIHGCSGDHLCTQF